MIVATLWAGPGSAISHESAMSVYGLAAAMPGVIHLSAPSAFTGKRAGVRIHHADVDSAEMRLLTAHDASTYQRPRLGS